jgi:hypothetical protein
MFLSLVRIGLVSSLLLVDFLHYLPNSPPSSADIWKFRLACILKLFFICLWYLVWYLFKMLCSLEVFYFIINFISV